MDRRLSLIVLALALGTASREADASLVTYIATLTGPNEAPPNTSPGTGFAEIDFDTTAHTLRVHVLFSDLLGPTTAAHIHAPTAIPFVGTANVATTVPTFEDFPLGVTSGTYSRLLDLTSASSYNPAFITANGGTTAGAEAALLASAAAGTSYLNVHSSEFPAGEIRGFLTPTAVPEPGSIVLLGSGIVTAMAYSWRRKRLKNG